MQTRKMFFLRFPSRYFFIPAFVSILFSCNTLFQPVQVQFEGYRVSGSSQNDSGLLRLMQPYSDSINKSMNAIVGEAAETLEKRQPEGSLNNFMTDAIRYAAEQHFKIPIDAAFVNYG